MTRRAAVLAKAAHLFPGRSFSDRVQRLRPHICPFEALMPHIPENSEVLDVGCGRGLLLGLLGAFGRCRRGVGLEISVGLVTEARAMATRLNGCTELSFQVISDAATWPDQTFDVVTMVDVMHHVPKPLRPKILSLVADRVRPGGVFVYKDISGWPAWRGLGNRLHDLIMAREWVVYEDVGAVAATLDPLGLRLEHQLDIEILWYAHQLRVYRKNLIVT